MFLGVVGFAMIVIIVAALIRSKSNPVPLFVIVPVIACIDLRVHAGTDL